MSRTSRGKGSDIVARSLENSMGQTVKRCLLVAALGALFGSMASDGLSWLKSVRAAPPATDSFKGVVGRTYKESTPYFAEPVTPPKGAPNVLLIMLDDVGF